MQYLAILRMKEHQDTIHLQTHHLEPHRFIAQIRASEKIGVV